MEKQIVALVEQDKAEELSCLATEHPDELEAIWNEKLAATAAHHGSLKVLMWMHRKHLFLSENVAVQAAVAGQVEILVWFTKYQIGPWNPLKVLSTLMEFHPHDNVAKLRRFCESVLGTESAAWSADRMLAATVVRCTAAINLV